MLRKTLQQGQDLGGWNYRAGAVSARDIMEALIGGQRDPKVLAQLARGKMRNKILALEEALDGADTFTCHHAFVLRMMLDNIDHITAQINGLTSRIEELIAPFERQVVQLDGIPGMGRIAAQDLPAEIGADMSVFRTAGHLVSWCTFCPQVKQSAGKRKGRNSKGRGNRYVAGALGEVTVSAGRSKTRIGPVTAASPGDAANPKPRSHAATPS